MSDRIQLRLRELRKEAGLSQKAVATAIGVTGGHLSQVERGGTGVSLDVLERYLHMCGYALELVPTGEQPDRLRQATAKLSPRQRAVLALLAEALPELPDVLVDELERQTSSWHARYVVETE